MPPPTSPYLAAALDAAHAAGDSLRRKYPQLREIKLKGPRDIVTDADLAAQKAILDILTHRFPDHALLSEEGRHDIDLTTATPTWIIDPLDGTTNYARRFPNFSVSIALAQGGVLQTAVVHDPLRRETFYAQKGQGAFLQRSSGVRRLRVSPTHELAEAVLSADWARDPDARRRTVEALTRIIPVCRTLRSIGTVALSLAYLAAGWLEAYYHLTPKIWDMAAGNLLVLEAGGQLTTPAGQPWRITDTELVASNTLLHDQVLTALALG